MEIICMIFFVAFVISEAGISLLNNKSNYNKKECFTNIGVGITAFAFDYGFTLLSIPALNYIYEHYRWFSPERNLYYFALLFLSLDLIEYWFHRISHTVPLFWSAHKVHHQSKYFNLTVGLRTSFFVPILNIAFYTVLPLLGFVPEDVLSCIFIQGFLQLLVHTELVGKLGFLEYIFVTPSVHRVHHGINEKYIDRNFGKTFVLWDILFNTYQKEEEKVIYGALHDEGETGIIKSQLIPIWKFWKQFRSRNNQ